jgi:import inner membrane translocase subunit TIM9
MTTPPIPQQPPALHQEREMLFLQIRESYKTINEIQERCFHACISDFTVKTVTSKEEICLYRCVDKYHKFTMRAGIMAAQITQEQMQSQSTNQ